jgi:hypothetical protein
MPESAGGSRTGINAAVLERLARCERPGEREAHLVLDVAAPDA